MAKIAFITQGCSANYNDTEIMKGLLEKAGYEIIENIEHADLVVFNTCAVKGPTESFFKKKLKELKDKKVVLAGCILQSENPREIAKKYGHYSIVGTYQISSIVDVVRETLKGRVLVNLVREHSEKLGLPKIKKNPIIGIVQIGMGCLDNCTYCRTKIAKGNLHSYRIREIRKEIEEHVKEGVKEIWLTSQDNGAYGKDIGSSLIELLKDISKIEGDFKVRIGMANPQYIMEFLDELLWIIRDYDSFFRFLHIPVQSGSNKVLKDMKRNYSVEDYIFIYKRAKEVIPDISISTDIIVGYPTEKEEDFKKTLELMENYPVDVLNRSKFWKRRGTPAYKLKEIPGEIVKMRMKKLVEAFNKKAKELNKRWIGWEGDVIIDEYGKKPGTYQGRNISYRPIVIDSNLELFGKNVTARVFECNEHYLKAHLIDAP